MKSTLLLPLLAIALFASSCRTVPTLDPMTGAPSARCQPGHGCHHSVIAGK